MGSQCDCLFGKCDQLTGYAVYVIVSSHYRSRRGLPTPFTAHLSKPHDRWIWSLKTALQWKRRSRPRLYPSFSNGPGNSFLGISLNGYHWVSIHWQNRINQAQNSCRVYCSRRGHVSTILPWCETCPGGLVAPYGAKRMPGYLGICLAELASLRNVVFGYRWRKMYVHY